MLFLDIFSTSIIPLFILIAIGVLLDKFFKIDIPTLSKLNFYIFSPALLFALIYESELQANEILEIGGFTFIHMVVLYVLAVGVFSLKVFAEKRPVLSMGTLFYNAGIYGIPLMLLAFDENAVGVVAIVLAVQAVLFFSVGIVLFDAGTAGLKQSLITLLKYPMLYAIGLGFLLRALGITLPEAITAPLDYIVGGFVAVALITLGAELSRSSIAGDIVPVSGITVVRLMLSPLAAAALLLVFDFDPEVARVLIVAAGLPVAVNVYVLAAELNKEAEFASRIVFWTTLLSGITIPVLLMFFR